MNRHVVDGRRSVDLGKDIRLLQTTPQPLRAGAYQMIWILLMDEPGSLINPAGKCLNAGFVGIVRSGTRLVGQLPGHDGGIIAVGASIDGVAALNEVRNVTAIELVGSGVGVKL